MNRIDFTAALQRLSVRRRFAELDPQVITVAVVVLVVTLAFGSYLDYRSALADARAEKQREGVCAILDRIAAGQDAGIDAARRAFHCGPPHPPPAFLGRPQPRRGPTPAPTVIIVMPTPTLTPTSAPAARPPARRRSSSSAPPPPPTRRPTHSPTPTPAPTPSPTCDLQDVLAHPLRCAHLP